MYNPPLGLEPIRVEVPDVDPQAFRTYIIWLDREIINFHIGEEEVENKQMKDKSLSWMQCYPLAAGYNLEARFNHLESQDVVIEELDRVLDLNFSVNLEILNYIFSQDLSIPKQILCCRQYV